MNKQAKAEGRKSNEGIPLRYGYAEHLGAYEIRAYLPAKMKAAAGGISKVNTDTGRKSWQQLHKTSSRAAHQRKLKELTNTGNYTINQ